jgi:tagaturonate reductase
MQFTSKMKMRNVPVLQKYYQDNDTPPACVALGFAAYILFMKANNVEGGKYFGEQNGVSYQIQDDQAAHLNDLWNSNTNESIVHAVLADTALWGTDLSALPGFAVVVNEYLQSLISNGGKKTLNIFQQNKTLA